MGKQARNVWHSGFGFGRARGKTFPNAHTNSLIIAQRDTALAADFQRTEDFIDLVGIEKQTGVER